VKPVLVMVASTFALATTVFLGVYLAI